MRFLLLAFCLLLAACPTMQPGGGYPAEITGIDESTNFPNKAAGYSRGKMFMYEPGMKNHSVAYDIYEPQIQNAVTLYFYEMALPAEQLFDAEKRQIIAAHPGATLLRESPATLQKDGVIYQAYTAIYRYSTVFAQQEQTVFSQLILVAHPKRYFKVRSTAPLNQAEAATANTQRLLESVNWAY